MARQTRQTRQNTQQNNNKLQTNGKNRYTNQNILSKANWGRGKLEVSFISMENPPSGEINDKFNLKGIYKSSIMVKLINIKHSGATSEFVARLNGLKIGKNAKIALDQISCTFAQNAIVIDDTNNSLQFTPYALTAGNLNNSSMGNRYIDVVMTEGNYLSVKAVLDELQDSLNAAVKFYSSAAGFSNYQGLQFQVIKDTTTEKVSINYANGTLEPYADFAVINDILTGNPGGVAGSFAVKTAGDDTKYDGIAQTKQGVSKSNGEIDFKVYFTDITAEVIFGLTKTDIAGTPEMGLDQYYAAIYSKAGDNTLWIKYDDTEEQLLNDANNATMTKVTTRMNFSIIYGGDTIEFYVQDVTNNLTVTSTKDFNSKHHASSNSFFTMATKQKNKVFMCINGGAAGTDFKALIDEFTTLNEDGHVVDDVTLSIRKYDNLQVNTASRYFKFTSTLNRILGYNYNGIIKRTPADNGSFVGDFEMPHYIALSGISPKNLVITVPSLELDSFQNFQYRQNVIATIPNQNNESSYELSYQTNNLMYIDIHNKQPHDLTLLTVKVTDDENIIFNIVPDTLNITFVIHDE